MLLVILIIAAAALLVTGVITADIVFTFVALGLAVVAAALIIGSTVLRNRGPAAAPSLTSHAQQGHDDEEPIETGHHAATSSIAATEAELDGPEDPELTSAELSNPVPATTEADNTSSSAPSTGANLTTRSNAHNTESALVFVLPGRKRFHRDTCELLRYDREELTLGEAREEGFTACTACASDLAHTTNSHVIAHRN